MHLANVVFCKKNQYFHHGKNINYFLYIIAIIHVISLIRDCNHSIQVKWISLKTAYHYKNIK